MPCRKLYAAPHLKGWTCYCLICAWFPRAISEGLRQNALLLSLADSPLSLLNYSTPLGRGCRSPVEHMLDLSPLADDQLVLRLTNGDASALEELYDRYVRQCFGLALRMLDNSAIAEEVVQEVFLKVWQQPYSYSSQKGKFVSWLLSLVHHKCIDELRRRSRTEVPLDDPVTGSLLDTTSDPDPDLADQVWVKEQQRIVRDALEEIAPNQRQILELAYFRGLSQSEIAARLNQPLGTVKTRTRQGLKNLRSILEAKGSLAD